MRRLRGRARRLSGHRLEDASSFRVPTVFCRKLEEASRMREVDLKLHSGAYRQTDKFDASSSPSRNGSNIHEGFR